MSAFLVMTERAPVRVAQNHLLFWHLVPRWLPRAREKEVLLQFARYLVKGLMLQAVRNTETNIKQAYLSSKPFLRTNIQVKNIIQDVLLKFENKNKQ